MTERHNPKCKLVQKGIKDGGKYIQLVYGVENDGTNEGLEAYYLKTADESDGHYRSARWGIEEIPKKYEDDFNELKSYVRDVPEGHKLII